MHRLKRDYSLLMVAATIVFILLFGTVGYVVIEKWSAFDAFYMTVITLGTVGYGETHELTKNGRIFTIILIFGGIVTMAITAQVIVNYIIRRNFLGDFRRRRMEKILNELKGHVIVCGYGKVGRHVADNLMRNGEKVVIVDRDFPDRDAMLDKGFIMIDGEATDEVILSRAGVERAAVLITVVGSDADNLFITMSAKGLNPEIRVIARADDAATRNKMLRVGAEKVVLPYEIGGRRIAALVRHPVIVEFLDTVMNSENMELRMGEAFICQQSYVVGMTLSDADIRRKTGAVVLAIQRASGDLITNPSADYVLEKDDRLICLGTSLQINTLQDLLGGMCSPY